MPKSFTAVTKVSDEYKEMDLSIGLTDIKAHLKKVSGESNTGMNDMEIYCKVLKTEDFARSIARKQVPGKNMTYGEYLGKKDTIASVLDNINYNYSNKHETLTIGFKDRDAKVASQMLDSVTSQLQDVVTRNRQVIISSALQNAKNELDSAQNRYSIAQKAYMDYEDSNAKVVKEVAKQQGVALSKEATLAYQQLKDATTQYVRQKALMQRATLAFATVWSNTTPQEYDIPFVGILLALLFPSFFLIKGIALYKSKKSFIDHLDWGNLFAPWNITIALWAFVLLCIFMLGEKLYPLTTQFYTSFSLWLSVFCISSFITYNLNKTDSQTNYHISTSVNYSKILFYILLAFSLVLSPLCVKKTLDIVTAFGSENLMQNIRMLAVEGEGFGLLDQCFIINKVLFIIAVWKYPKVSIWQVLLIFFLLILNSIAIMDKGTLFFIVIVIVFVLYEKRKIKTAHLAIGGSIIVVLFFMLTVLRGGTDDEGNFNSQMDLLEFLAIYIFANPVAFSYLNQAVVPQFGANTFYLLYYYLDRYGFGDYIVVDIVQEFVQVPVSTNLYTIMQPFYVDFGEIGVAYFALIYGVFTGWCYAGYRKGNSAMKCLYTYMVMVLVLQFGQEQIFLLPIVFLKVCFLIYILTQRTLNLTTWYGKDNTHVSN
jgi:oligosaccharide repeat unit polymerase